MNIRPAPRSGVIKEPDENTGLAIASLILSLASITFAMIPFVGLLGPGGWIVGIVLGILTLKSTSRSRNKIMAIAGIVISLFGLITFITLLVLAFGNGTL